MDNTRWQEVDALFGEALEVDEDRRDAFLKGRCGDDGELRRAVDRLLALEVEAESFLAEPAVPRSARARLEPSGVLDGLRIGPYRLLRPLGHGGMGSVYLARREDDYRQDVAVKLVRRGLMSEDVWRRFRNERQILARLEHPNIARLYDGGTTAEGLPYLVMERIEGLPVDRYCDHHRLTVRRRLELFRQICVAVGYAHGHGLVHCDLKPSNILVTDEGTPKLLDFGIAKLLRDDELGAEPTLTPVGFRPATPGYASPEQLSGQAITPVSDVYSLGVLLYKMICGHRPYAAIDPHLQVRPILFEDEPEKPSRRVFESLAWDGDEITPECLAQRRGTTPRQLVSQLHGDLDAIALEALCKEPGERYSTVDALSQDISAHLEARPVSARHGRRSFRAVRRLRRLVLPADAGRRRERLFWATAFTLALLVSLALVAPRLSFLGSQVETVEDHLADAREARERYDYNLQRSAAVRAVQGARLQSDESSLAAALLLAAEAHDALGEANDADKALVEASRIFEERILEERDDRLGLARATLVLRNPADLGRLPISFEEALDVFVEYGDRQGEAMMLIRLGKMAPPEERAQGEDMIQRGLEIAREIGDLRAQAEAWSNLASLSYGFEDLLLAEKRFGKAVHAARQSGDARLEAGFMMNWSRVHHMLGNLATHDDLVEKAVKIIRRIEDRGLLATSLPALADARLRSGDRKGMELYEEAQKIAIGIGDARITSIVLERSAKAWERLGEHTRALARWQTTHDHYRDLESWEQAARAEIGIASNLSRLGHAVEAETRLLALAEKYSIDDKTYEYTALLIRLRLAENRLAQDKDAEAEKILAVVLPRVVAKDEAELHRLAVRLAAETDAAVEGTVLADLLVREEIGAVAEGNTERMLRIQLDLGRLLWYSGDESGAGEHFEEVRRGASELGHVWLAGMAAREAEELARVRFEAP